MVELAARPGRLERARDRLRLGPYSAVWLAVTGWATCALFVRAAHEDAVRFTTWRLLFALLPLWVLVTVRSARSGRPTSEVFSLPGAGAWAWVGAMAVGGALFAGGATTAFAALNNTTLLDATLIPSLQPVVVIAAAVVLLDERVSSGLVGRCLVAVAGTALVAMAGSGRGSWSLAGDLLAVLSLFINAGWHLYGRWIRHRFGLDPIVFMAGTLTFAALFMTPFALVTTGGIGISRAAAGYALLVMAVGTGAHITMLWAHRYVPASASAPIMLIEPPMVALAGWAAFGEAPTLFEFAGSIVVVAALVGVVRQAEVEAVDDLDEEALEPPV